MYAALRGIKPQFLGRPSQPPLRVGTELLRLLLTSRIVGNLFLSAAWFHIQIEISASHNFVQHSCNILRIKMIAIVVRIMRTKSPEDERRSDCRNTIYVK